MNYTPRSYIDYLLGKYEANPKFFISEVESKVAKTHREKAISTLKQLMESDDFWATLKSDRNFNSFSNRISGNQDMLPKIQKAVFYDEIDSPIPDKEAMLAYIEDWNSPNHIREQYNDLFLTDLFKRNNSNSDEFAVMAKVTALDDLYTTQLHEVTYDMTQHIVKNHEEIDSYLASGNPKAVDLITYLTLIPSSKSIVPVLGKEQNNEETKVKRNSKQLSFATKYCHFSAPEKSYVIYDSYVCKVLVHFYNFEKYSNIFKERNYSISGGIKYLSELNYEDFKQIEIDFIRYFITPGYEEDSHLREYDQFIWLFGKTYFPNYKKNTSKDEG